MNLEHYTQLDGQKVTKCYCNNGYFYVSSDVDSILNDFRWHLHKEHNTNHGTQYVMSSISAYAREKYDIQSASTINIHQIVFFMYAGYNYDTSSYVIDHLNSVQLDNTDMNLDIVTRSRNSYNNFSQGYQLMRRPNRPLGFHPRFWSTVKNKNIGAIHYKDLILRDLGIKIESSSTKSKLNELDCCRIQNYLEYNIANNYKFDFTKFRRYDLDLLDDLRCGRLSEDDELYKFLTRYNNAWYYYRYNLSALFERYNIKKPDIFLDSEGFLVDKNYIRLNPFLGGKIK